MKTFIRKISLLLVGVVSSVIVKAQVIELSAAAGGLSQTIDNGSTFDATKLGPITINLKDYLPVTVSIKNTSTTTALVLSKMDGKYVVISGSGASDFTIDESLLTGTIVAGATQTFTVNFSSSATNGSNKLVSFSIKSNSTTNSTDGVYSGSMKYNLSGITPPTPTSITKASDIGLSLYPNPSNDGVMHVSANNVDVERIVVSNVAGQTEEFTSKEFTTTFKGLLLVRLYTNKGVVSEKVIINE